MPKLSFTLFGKPEPQGSTRAFVVNGRARVTSDNSKLKPYRHSLTQVALEELSRLGINAPLCARKLPVEVHILWTLAKPKSTPKHVTEPTKKPDADKLLRACLDSLTGVAYEDDAQVVSATIRKQYGAPERTEITVQEVNP